MDYRNLTLGILFGITSLLMYLAYRIGKKEDDTPPIRDIRASESGRTKFVLAIVVMAIISIAYFFRSF